MTEVTPELLARLRDLAGEATPGPWVVRDYRRDGFAPLIMGDYMAVAETFDKPHLSDCHFIAAASPDVVAALVAEIERLREAVGADLSAEQPTSGQGDDDALTTDQPDPVCESGGCGQRAYCSEAGECLRSTDQPEPAPEPCTTCDRTDSRCKAIGCGERQDDRHTEWWCDYGCCSRACAIDYYGREVIE